MYVICVLNSRYFGGGSRDGIDLGAVGLERLGCLAFDSPDKTIGVSYPAPGTYPDPRSSRLH